MRAAAVVVLVLLGCAPAAPRVASPRPIAVAAEPVPSPPPAVAPVAITDPGTSIVATPSIPDAILAVGGKYQPTITEDPAAAAAREANEAALDKKWGKPWRTHVPKASVDKKRFEEWAASLGESAERELDVATINVVKAHALASLRATWLAVLNGGENATSEQEEFERLIEECRRAVADVDAAAKKVRARYADASPEWGAQACAAETAALSASLVAATPVEPGYVRWEAQSAVAAAFRAMVETTREGTLDAALAVAVARHRAEIMSYARRPKEKTKA